MSFMEQKNKTHAFYDLHQRGCFLMPNVWDAGTAKLFSSMGFSALASTSAGIAFSKGLGDHGSAKRRIGRDEMLSSVREIVGASALPVNADLEAGFGDRPEDVAATIKGAIDAGAAGGNIEDYTGNPNNPFYDIELACDRIRAAREAIDQSGLPFVLVGRSDCLAIFGEPGCAETIDRVNRYYEAGADCLFAPGVSNRESIQRFVKDVDGPINVVMGLTGADLSMGELAELGVRRVSIGGSLARNMYFNLQKAAIEMRDVGTFSYAKQQIEQSTLNTLFDGAFDE